MQVFSSLEAANLRGVFLAIGTFDGVHRGHRLLLENMIAAARTANAPSAALSFSPHPRLVLGNDPDFRYLTTEEERLRLFETLGLSAAILQTFTLELAHLTATEFLGKLAKHVGLQSIWVGDGFSLGREREGNVSFLHEYGRRNGFSVRVIPPLTIAGEPVSSSRIRKALSSGDVGTAALLLGRSYALEGTVVRGDGRGNSLGTPTANLLPPALSMIPARGIYATRVFAEGTWRGGVTSIGIRPTFTAEQLPESIIETYIFDFDGDLYGQQLRLEFSRRLRDELRFADVPALQAQIQEDIRIARRIWEDQP